jgi:hypothetical protein
MFCWTVFVERSGEKDKIQQMKTFDSEERQNTSYIFNGIVPVATV